MRQRLKQLFPRQLDCIFAFFCDVFNSLEMCALSHILFQLILAAIFLFWVWLFTKRYFLLRRKWWPKTNQKSTLSPRRLTQQKDVYLLPVGERTYSTLWKPFKKNESTFSIVGAFFKAGRTICTSKRFWQTHTILHKRNAFWVIDFLISLATFLGLMFANFSKTARVKHAAL